MSKYPHAAVPTMSEYTVIYLFTYLYITFVERVIHKLMWSNALQLMCSSTAFP